ncbi:MAG: hypothetical protein QOH71_1476 [Blastocatellia bacterium]|jgi:hypothetical protein|nr:hypothetical protein [Blastocatellia bacterium]
MKLAKRIVLSLYGVQLFIIVPWFLGEMYRNELSPYVWRAYAHDLELHGSRDALFVVYGFVLFYSALIFFPYITLKAAYKSHRHDVGIVLILSLWFPITFLVFADSIFLFLRAAPYFIFLVAWAAITLFIGIMWKNFHVASRARKRE